MKLLRLGLLCTALWLGITTTTLLYARRQNPEVSRFLGTTQMYGETHVVSLAGDVPRLVQQAIQPTILPATMLIAPDGRQAAFIHEDEVYALNLLTLRTRHLSNISPDKVYLGGWSPDSRWFFYQTHIEREAHLVRVRADGRDALSLAGLHERSMLGWSPDGEWLIVSTRAGIQRIETTSGRIDPINNLPVYRPQNFEVFDQNEALHWSPDGQWMYYGVEDGCCVRLFRHHSDGTHQEPVIAQDSDIIWGGFSPDGDWLILTIDSGDSADLYRARPDGSDLERLTTLPGHNELLTWSPDGEWVIFRNSNTADIKLYQMRPDGGEQHLLATATTRIGVLGWWSDWLVYWHLSQQTEIDMVGAIERVQLDSPAPYPLLQTDYRLRDFQWSPDGEWLYVSVSLIELPPRYYALRLADGFWAQVSNFGTDFRPGWTPDGTRVIFGEYGDDGYQLVHADVDGTNRYSYTGLGISSFKAWLPVVEKPWNPAVLLGMTGAGALLMFLWKKP